MTGALPFIFILVLGLVVLTVIFSRSRSGTRTTALPTDQAHDAAPRTMTEAGTKGLAPLKAGSVVPSWARGVAALLDNPGRKGGSGDIASMVGGFSAWMKFNAKGKELGFSMAELQFMYQTAGKLGLDKPADLLWSAKAIDHCVQAMFWQHLKDGSINTKPVEDFLFRIMQYRQGMELGRPRRSRGLVSTRSLEPGQVLKIMVPRVGMFMSKVVELDRAHLLIELPKGKALTGGFTWKGTIIEVYFWRKDDAGYYFESKVFSSPERVVNPTIRIMHTEYLIRTQKRANLRLKLIEDAWISPLQSFQNANEVFAPDGAYLCRLLDISMSGAAVLVRGVMEQGFLVKLQTRLAGMEVVMCGEIKAVNINREKRYSVLHIEAVPPSKAMRIRILAHVLGVTRVDSTLEPLPAQPLAASPVAEAEGPASVDDGESLFEMPGAEQIAKAERSGSDLEDLHEEKP